MSGRTGKEAAVATDLRQLYSTLDQPGCSRTWKMLQAGPHLVLGRWSLGSSLREPHPAIAL